MMGKWLDNVGAIPFLERMNIATWKGGFPRISFVQMERERAEKGKTMSKEFIFELDNALYNEETGEAVFKPKVKGELVRCEECIHKKDIGIKNTIYCPVVDSYEPKDWFCADGKRKENADAPN